MALSFTVLPGPTETVVAVTGDIDGPAAMALDEQLTHAADYGMTVVVDLSGVESLEPVGLSVLYRAQSRCRSREGELVLVAPNIAVLKVLQNAGLADLFEIQVNRVRNLTGYGI